MIPLTPSKLIGALRDMRATLALRKALKDGLVMGKDVKIAGVQPFSSEPYLIKLGDGVGVAANVIFITHDASTRLFRNRPEYRGLQRIGRIDIEDGCFIGAGAVLLPGIRIGPNSVVGAGSIVSRSVPPNTVVAGAPARPICTVEEFIEKSIPRCMYIPPEIAADRKKFKRFLLENVPAPEADPPVPASKASGSTNGRAKVEVGSRG